jgi:hypothetical protein
MEDAYPVAVLVESCRNSIETDGHNRKALLDIICEGNRGERLSKYNEKQLVPDLFEILGRINQTKFYQWMAAYDKGGMLALGAWPQEVARGRRCRSGEIAVTKGLIWLGASDSSIISVLAESRGEAKALKPTPSRTEGEGNMIEAKMILDRVTKGAVRYMEPGHTAAHKIGGLYLRKDALPQPWPGAITVVVTPEPAAKE